MVTLAPTRPVDNDVAVSLVELSKTYPVPFLRLKQFFGRKGKPPVEALRRVSFDVKRGEIFGLIGRNGAGKTTITKIIATLVQPTAGKVAVNGFDSVEDDQSVRSQVGLAGAEERSFYWRLTGEQNLLFFARLYGMKDSSAKARITELLHQFELQDARRRRFGELSTGNKQRLAVVRALLSNPPILLLDEPTRSLDPLAASRMRKLIASLSHQDPPVTILLTSHNLNEVESLCDRVAIISRGEIKATDSPTKLSTFSSDKELIHVTVQGMDEASARLLVGETVQLTNTRRLDEDSILVSFERESDDRQLDSFLRVIQQHQGTILNIETERPTLLRALESYENESDTTDSAPRA
jgi:ABC-2 type transport system ATP-binding protein